MKEIIILVIVAASSLFIFGYTIHMFIGGLVSESTERWAIIAAVSVAAIVMGFLGADIIKQRRRR